MFCLRSPTTPPSTHTPHIWVCVHGSSFSGHASLGLNMALECVCALIQCVCVCVRLHDCPLISTIWAHSLPAVSPVTKRSGWLSAAINNINKRSAGGNHFPPCWNGISYIFSLGSLLTGSVLVCVLTAGSETFLPRWGNNFWRIKSLSCANRLMRLWKVQSPFYSVQKGFHLKTFNWVREQVSHLHTSVQMIVLVMLLNLSSVSLQPHTFCSTHFSIILYYLIIFQIKMHKLYYSISSVLHDVITSSPAVSCF